MSEFPKARIEARKRRTVMMRVGGVGGWRGDLADYELVTYIASFYGGNRSEAMRTAVRAYAMFLHRTIDKGE